VFDPYFNRTYKHFCSHQHAPPREEPSGFACGVRNGPILYLAHAVFTNYRNVGQVACRHYVAAAIRALLGEETVTTNLPSSARVSLMDQPNEGRYVLHLLHANTVLRGGGGPQGDSDVAKMVRNVEVIEYLLPLRDTEVRLRLPKSPVEARRVLVDDGIEWKQEGEELVLKIDEFTCHEMISLRYNME
jgi:hypothetical protein